MILRGKSEEPQLYICCSEITALKHFSGKSNEVTKTDKIKETA